MTREEQIRYKAGDLADFAIAHGAPWEEYHNGFIDGAKWADEHPVQPSLPSNLDEAANNYGIDIRLGYPRVMDEIDRYIYNAFKAGAEWMAGQGVRASASVGYYNQCGLSILTEPSIKKLGFKEGDELEITLRKK